MNTRERFGFAERVLFDQRWLVSGERVERQGLMAAVFAVLERQKVMREAFSEVVAVKKLGQ